MRFSEKVKAITTTYSDLRNIENEKDLHDAGLTLAGYHAAIDIFNDVSRPNTQTTTIMQDVAEYFKKHGYNVTRRTIDYLIAI